MTTTYTDSDLYSSGEDARQSTPSRSAPNGYNISKSAIHGRLQGPYALTESHQETQRLSQSSERKARLNKWVAHHHEALKFAPVHAQGGVPAPRLSQGPKGKYLIEKKRKYHKQVPTRHPNLNTKLGRRTESARVRAEVREIIQTFIKSIDNHRASLLLQKKEMLSLRAQLDELRPRKKRKVQTDPNKLFAPFAAILRERAMLAQRDSLEESYQHTEDESEAAEESERAKTQPEKEALSYPKLFLRARTRYNYSSGEESAE